MIRLIGYAHSAYTSACDVIARAHDARPHCRLKSSFQETPASTRISFILPETRVPELYDGCYIVLVYLYLLLHNSFRKPRKCVQNER